MTREEAIIKAINIVSYFEAHFAKSKEAREDAVNIIEVLEQEPCTDAINRQAVLDMMQMRMGAKELYRAVYDLPPVEPAEKVGRWVFVKGYEGILYECTVCKNKNTHTTVRWNYCPNCGAKMQEVEA